MDQCLDKDFDLILVDWNLNPGESGEKLSGEKLIDEIRHKEIFTEIIFYSALDRFEDQPFKLDGVYFTHTDIDGDKLFSRMKEIIKHTLNQNLRISVTRGLFITSTIELVENLEDIISKILGLEGDTQKFFTDYVVQAEFFNDFSKYTIIKDFLKQKIAILEENINSSKDSQTKEMTEKLEDIKKIKNTFNKFQQDVIELRNDLAHAKPISDQRNCLNVRNKQKRIYEKCEFTLAKCKEIRKKFIFHADNIEKIAALLETS